MLVWSYSDVYASHTHECLCSTVKNVIRHSNAVKREQDATGTNGTWQRHAAVAAGLHTWPHTSGRVKPASACNRSSRQQQARSVLRVVRPCCCVQQASSRALRGPKHAACSMVSQVVLCCKSNQQRNMARHIASTLKPVFQPLHTSPHSCGPANSNIAITALDNPAAACLHTTTTGQQASRQLPSFQTQHNNR